MKYSVSNIIRCAIGLFFGLYSICLTIVVQPFAWLGDLIIRLCGAAIMLLLGFAYGFCKGKDGADNE